MDLKKKKWNIVPLKEICTKPQYGYTTSGADSGEIKLLRTTDITPGFIDWKKVPYCKDAPDNFEKFLLKENDIVVSRAGSIGVSILIKNPDKSVFASYLIRFQPIETIVFPEYMAFFLQSPLYWKNVNEKSSGITLQNINATKLESIGIPLPNLDTQRLIVSEIEKQFSRLDEGLSSLMRIKENLKSYRASLLKSAVEGRLTAEWRAEHLDIENANILLDRIRTARREKWITDNPGKKYKEVLRLKEDTPIELPNKWTHFRLNDIIRVGTGATPYKGNSNYWSGGTIPWITSSCVNEKIVLEATNFITELALKETNVKLFPEGSLIVALYGEGKTRGKITELGIEASTNQACAALVFDETNSILKSYIKIFFEKNYIDLRRMSAGGVQPNLNVGIIQNLTIPLPSLSEQHRIVEILEEKFSVIDSLESFVNANIRRAENLKQAILKKAFSGELISE